jgi:hypothetical protein
MEFYTERLHNCNEHSGGNYYNELRLDAFQLIGLGSRNRVPKDEGIFKVLLN